MKTTRIYHNTLMLLTILTLFSCRKIADEYSETTFDNPLDPANNPPDIVVMDSMQHYLAGNIWHLKGYFHVRKDLIPNHNNVRDVEIRLSNGYRDWFTIHDTIFDFSFFLTPSTRYEAWGYIRGRDGYYGPPGNIVSDSIP
jgi:hypothetical protein